MSSTSPPKQPTTTTTTTNYWLRRSYTITKVGMWITAGMIFAMPDRTLTTLLVTQWGGAIGFAICGSILHVLSEAHSQNRLSSHTYKRLHLGVMAFTGLGLVSIPGEAAFLSSPIAASVVSMYMTLVRLFSFVTAFVGWKRGVEDVVKLDSNNNNNTETVERSRWMSEIVRGTKETVAGFKVKNSKKALTYRNCLILVCMGIVSNFCEGLFQIRYQREFTRTWFEISLQWSAVSRLVLIATMIYTLKDAAERDRLSGTTFIQLNVLVGTWATIVGFGQTIYPLGFAAYRGIEMLAFAIPFFLKAYRSQREKRAETSKG